MKWPWSKPEEPENDACDPTTIDEARDARESSEHDLAKIRETREEIENIVHHLREIRTRNHLLEAFEQSLKRRSSGRGEHA